MSIRILGLAVTLFLSGCNDSTAKYGPVTYAAVGASDTVGVGLAEPEKDAWVAVVNDRLPDGSSFLSLGVSGSTVEQAIEDQLPRASKARADLITIWLAVNDLNARVPAQDYGKSLGTLVDKLADEDTRVFVGNVPDLTIVPIYASVPRTLLLQQVTNYNAEIADVVKDTDSVLVDLFELSRQLHSEAAALFSSDGFHPSEKGHEFLAEQFWRAISKDRQIGPKVTRD